MLIQCLSVHESFLTDLASEWSDVIMDIGMFISTFLLGESFTARVARKLFLFEMNACDMPSERVI